MAIIVHTRRALKAMRHQRQRCGPEEDWIKDALTYLDNSAPIPPHIHGKLKKFATKCLRWR